MTNSYAMHRFILVSALAVIALGFPTWTAAAAPGSCTTGTPPVAGTSVGVGVSPLPTTTDPLAPATAVACVYPMPRDGQEVTITYLGSTERTPEITHATGAVEGKQCRHAPRSHDPDDYACIIGSASVVAWVTPQGDAALKPGTSICEDRDDWAASRCYTADAGVGVDGYGGPTMGAGGYATVCESYGTLAADATTCLSPSSVVPTWINLTQVQRIFKDLSFRLCRNICTAS